MCEDYRAGLGVDREHDDTDQRAGRRIACPLQVLWATHDDMADLYGDVLGVWRDWAGDRLDGGPIDSGHHMAEEAPEALATALLTFWRSVEGLGGRAETV
jgi:haloacetate dehalogenase